MPKNTNGIPAETYRIVLPGTEEWALKDLYQLPHTYEQCYSFVYCLDTELPARDRERVDEAFASYPFKGGYSYVNIYSVLYRQLPGRAKPRIKGVHKSSPGWLDLFLDLDAAICLAKSIAVLASSAVAATAAYAKAIKILANIKVERERARLKEIQLTQQQIRATKMCCDELAKSLGFKNLAELHRRTNNPEVSLKLLAAHYRRMDVLVEYDKDEKAIFPIDNEIN